MNFFLKLITEMTIFGRFSNFKQLKIFQSHIKLLTNIVFNFQNFYSKIKVFIEQKQQKKHG